MIDRRGIVNKERAFAAKLDELERKAESNFTSTETLDRIKADLVKRYHDALYATPTSRITTSRIPIDEALEDGSL